jgi:hypothetical protein
MRWTRLIPLALMSACGNGCSIARALYIAVVHNSGAPTRVEIQRIDAREREFLRTLSTQRLRILPVAILGSDVRADPATARAIATQLTARTLGQATAVSKLPELPFERQPNEAVILWSRFKALAAAVAQQPPTDADYVVLVDVIGVPDRGSVGAVHVMAVTAKGDMAYRRLWNSHQPLYQEVEPRSLDDVVRMVVTDLHRGASGSFK